MTDRKILMLWPDISEDWARGIKEKYTSIVRIENLYKPSGKVFRGIRKLFSQLGLSTGFFLADWKKEIKEMDLIIIHTDIINITVWKWLRKNNYKGRIVYWYWNPISNSVLPQRINRKECEIWSFDPEDCKKFNLKYNTTYYSSQFVKMPDENVKKYDIFFIGQDKKRIYKLLELQNELEKENITSLFWIVKDKSSSSKYNYKENINYEENVNLVNKSKVILEFVQEGQAGLTLRSMEALFFQKKLITNNKYISNYNFYNKNNYFILGVDNWNGLKEFLSTPYVTYEKGVIEYYLFENWLERLWNQNEFFDTFNYVNDINCICNKI